MTSSDIFLYPMYAVATNKDIYMYLVYPCVYASH